MRRRLLACLVAAAALSTATPLAAAPAAGVRRAPPSASAGPQAPAGTTRLVVRARHGADPAPLAATAARAGGAGPGAAGPAAPSALLPGTRVVEVPAAGAAAALSALRRRPDVAWAEPDVRVRAARRVPDDPCWRGCPDAGDAAALEQVGAPDAWEVTTGDPAVRVGVLDTAVDVAHPDLAGKVDVGPSFSAGTGDCSDEARAAYAGHGTAVAGLVGAGTGNGRGVAGLGWDTRVLAVQVLDACGAGWASDVAAGLRWALDQGVPIVNLSLAAPDAAVLREAVEEAAARGVLVVAAAGNDGTPTPRYPAAYDGVVAVGALDAVGDLAAFSGRGRWVDLVAPGVGVPAAAPGDGYVRVSGTSYAAPLVAATAALLLAAAPGQSAATLAGRLAGTAGDFDPAAAWGRLDAGAALTRPWAGLWLVAGDGAVVAAGDAPSVPPVRVAPVAAAAARAGLWVATGDGTVVSTGGAADQGSMAGTALHRPVVGMAATPSGAGYWLVAADGGVFSFGDAGFHGSTGGMALNRPVVGMAATPSGAGYWLVAEDGGVFAFGDAPFAGSTGGMALHGPVVGLAPSAAGAGYWLVAADGGVFSFGDAAFHGSTGGAPGAAPVVGMVPSASGAGYWVAAADGTVHAFGDARPLRGAGVGAGLLVTALAAVRR